MGVLSRSKCALCPVTSVEGDVAVGPDEKKRPTFIPRLSNGFSI